MARTLGSVGEKTYPGIILKVELMDIECERRVGIKDDSKGFNTLGAGWRGRSRRRPWEFGFDLLKSEMLMRYHVEMLSWRLVM